MNDNFILNKCGRSCHDNGLVGQLITQAIREELRLQSWVARMTIQSINTHILPHTHNYTKSCYKLGTIRSQWFSFIFESIHNSYVCICLLYAYDISML